MEYRYLGKSDLKVSVIGLGSNNFGELMNQEQSLKVIHHALELGINFIDTADSYGDGKSEIFIGQAIRKSRHDVIVATKFGSPRSVGPDEKPGTRSFIMKAIDRSLMRLKTDYIDLYYMHKPDLQTPIEETLRGLDDVVKMGKARYVSCSNFSAWQLCDALWTSKVNNLASFIVTQMSYNLLDRAIEAELIPCCQNFGLGFIPYSPLAGGFLTGKYQKGIALSPESRFAAWKSTATKILNVANYDKLEKFEAFAIQHQHNMTQLAFAWLLSHPWLCSVIAGATSPDQLSANVAASTWKLTDDEISQLESC